MDGGCAVMDHKEWNNNKRELKRSIKESMRTGNFKGMDREIGSVVNDTVDLAIDEVKKAIGSIQGQGSTHRWENSPENSYKEDKNYNNEYNRKYQAYNKRGNRKNIPTQRPYYMNTGRNNMQKKRNSVSFAHNPIGKVSGIIYQIFGMIGSISLGTAIVVLAIIGLATSSLGGFMLPIAIMMPFFLGSLVLESRGSGLRNRYKRFLKYLHIIGNRHFVKLYEMTELSDMSYKFLVKDLKKMIRIGMFPQASIDTDRGMMYLSRAGYEQYRYLSAEEESKQQEEQELQEELHNGSEVVLSTGEDYIRRINDLRVKLKEEETVAKIIHMEAVLTKIMEYISKHPDQKDEVRRLMDYYLPTTIKLLTAFYDFEQQPIQGDNIVSTKDEIKGTIDTINLAFEKLLDQLFKDIAWDISTDISVLETMLAQEGLTDKGINKSNTMGE